MSFTKDQRAAHGRHWHWHMDTGWERAETVEQWAGRHRNIDPAEWPTEWNKPGMPMRRRDGYGTRKWKANPAGEPFRVYLDGVIDLHPSQWSDVSNGR